MGERLVSNGIDPRTGEPLVDVDEDDLAALLAAGAGADAGDPLDTLGIATSKALPWNVPPTDLARAGWTVVFAAGEDPAVRDALAPLVEHRKGQVEADHHHVSEHHPGEDVIDWLARHNVNPGTIDPSRVGYYVLLVGSPARIPFEFQYLLDVEYAVGRVHFDTADDYRRYAESVVASETGGAEPRDRTAVFWGPRHSWDRATHLSADQLLTPLVAGRDGRAGIAEQFGFTAAPVIGEGASRQALLDVLAGRSGAGRPGLLVTASHGLGGLPPGDADQRRRHGALVTQDWKRGPVPPDAEVNGDDVADARVHGMVAFVFACYGAGTPAYDDFPRSAAAPPVQIALEPFVAHLPRALLAHPEGGALAAIGHVERAWGYSITSKGGSQLQRFEDVLGQLLSAVPVGHAMKVVNDAHAVLAASLAQQLRLVSKGEPVPARKLLALWMERTDAQNYVVVGDPAVALRT